MREYSSAQCARRVWPFSTCAQRCHNQWRKRGQCPIGCTFCSYASRLAKFPTKHMTTKCPGCHKLTNQNQPLLKVMSLMNARNWQQCNAMVLISFVYFKGAMHLEAAWATELTGKALIGALPSAGSIVNLIRMRIHRWKNSQWWSRAISGRLHWHFRRASSEKMYLAWIFSRNDAQAAKRGLRLQPGTAQVYISDRPLRFSQQCPSNVTYVIECQRRQGCGFRFFTEFSALILLRLRKNSLTFDKLNSKLKIELLAVAATDTLWNRIRIHRGLKSLCRGS